MSILAQITTLEEAVAQMLGRVSLATASDRRAAQATTDALLALLDEHDLTADWLNSLEGSTAILDALTSALTDWSDELRQQIAANVTEIVTATEAFYLDNGLDVSGLRLAAQRSELAQDLGQAFERGMVHLDQQLYNATKDTMRDAVLTGRIDRDQIESDIHRHAGTRVRHARTQAQAAVAGLNQVYRNQVAQRGELTHWHYYGSLIINSRDFCRVHASYVFPQARVEQMRNGMLEPVNVFKGGFNCRHGLLPVDPEWSNDLATRIVDEEPTDIKSGRLRLTVIAPAGRVARLTQQIQLRNAGYHIFFDAQTNITGFVAIKTAWWTERFKRRAGTTRRKEMDDQLEDALRQAEAGHVVKLELEKSTE